MADVKSTLALFAAVAFGIALSASASAQDRGGYSSSIMKEEGGVRAKPRVRDEGWEKPAVAPKKTMRRARGSSSPSPVPRYQSTVTPLGTARAS